MKQHPYAGASAALGTMHEKERAVAPILAHMLQISVHTAAIDTDRFGTFSGVVPRTGTACDAARHKAQTAMQESGLPFGIGSEGSFGPHRLLPFAAENHEILLWVDGERGIEIMEQSVTAETNYRTAVISSWEELQQFSRQAQFPAHGLVLKADGYLEREMNTEAELQQAWARCVSASSDGMVLVQTDMRAHRNPTRMKHIQRVAEQLARRLYAQCPACRCPGWGVVRVEAGLPCELCRLPTALSRWEVYGCVRCGLEEQRERSDGRKAASAAYCAICNP